MSITIVFWIVFGIVFAGFCGYFVGSLKTAILEDVLEYRRSHESNLLAQQKNKDLGELIDIFDELYEDEDLHFVGYYRMKLTEILHHRGYFTCKEIKWNSDDVEEEKEPHEASWKGVRKIVDPTGKYPTVYNCPFCHVFTITADGTMNLVGFPRGYCSQCGREFTLPKECEEATR